MVVESPYQEEQQMVIFGVLWGDENIDWGRHSDVSAMYGYTCPNLAPLT